MFEWGCGSPSMKRNLFPLMGIAFVVAIAATGIFYGLFVGKISGATPSANAPGNAPAVAVAVRALERGTVMRAADFKIAPVTVPGSEHGYPTVDELAGQTLVRPLPPGQPLTPSSLVASPS